MHGEIREGQIMDLNKELIWPLSDNLQIVDVHSLPSRVLTRSSGLSMANGSLLLSLPRCRR